MTLVLSQRLRSGQARLFAGQHWSLVRADSDATDAFYCPHPVHISGKRRGLVVQWRGRKVSIEDFCGTCAYPLGAVQLRRLWCTVLRSWRWRLGGE